MDQNQNLPKHAWLRVYLPEGGVLLAFTYQERTAGWAARGVSLDQPTDPSGDELYRVLEQPDRVFRLVSGGAARVEPLSAAEASRLGLPAQPEWLAFFEAPTASEAAPAPAEAAVLSPAKAVDPSAPAEEPAAAAPVAAAPLTAADEGSAPAAVDPRGAPTIPIEDRTGEDPRSEEERHPWRTTPGLAGHFHPTRRDDVEVLFFFPHLGRVERLWVRLKAEAPDGFLGELQDTPSSPSELAEGSEVVVRVAPGAPLPIYLSPTMQENLKRCVVRCQACDFDLMMMPLSGLVSRSLPPGLLAGQVLFTCRCPLCGKTMLVELKGPPPVEAEGEAAPVSREEAHEVLWAAASFGAFLLLVIILWLLRPLAGP